MWIVGVLINLAGSLGINFSTNLIKLAHNRNQKIAVSHGPSPPILRSPLQWYKYGSNALWLWAMTLFSVSNWANFASFAFAAQSLLTALGSVQFLSNVIFSWVVNHEPPTRWVICGTVVIVTGAVLLVIFGDHESPVYTADQLRQLYSGTGYIIYLSISAAVVVLTYVVFRIGKRRVGGLYGQPITGAWGRWLPILYTLFAGIPGTQSVMYGKSLSLLVRATISGNSQFTEWYTYLAGILFFITATFWMMRFDKALKLFPVSTMAPLLQVSWLFFSMVSGGLYFQEIQSMGSLGLGMFGAGTVILLIGVWILTTSTLPKTNDEEPIIVPEEDVVPSAKGGDTNEENSFEGVRICRNESARHHPRRVTWSLLPANVSPVCLPVGSAVPDAPPVALSRMPHQRRHTTVAIAAHAGPPSISNVNSNTASQRESPAHVGVSRRVSSRILRRSTAPSKFSS